MPAVTGPQAERTSDRDDQLADLQLAASPNCAGSSGTPPSASPRTTARSDSGSRPTTENGLTRPSANEADPRSPAATTCAAVSIRPSAAMTTAEPNRRNPTHAPVGATARLATDRRSRRATVETTREYSSRGSVGATGESCTVVMM